MNKNFSFLPRKKAIEPQQYRGMAKTKHLYSLVLFEDTHIKHDQSSKINLRHEQKSQNQKVNQVRQCKEFKKEATCLYLDGHGRKDNKIAQIESKGSNKEPELVFFSWPRRLPRVQVPERSYCHCTAHSHHGKVRWKHLAL